MDNDNILKNAIQAQLNGYGEPTEAVIGEEKLCLLTGRTIRKPLFYESMTKATEMQSGATIRVWRTVKEVPEYTDSELNLTIAKIPPSADMRQVFDIIGSLEHVAAAELTDRDGNGVVAYYVWP